MKTVASSWRRLLVRGIGSLFITLLIAPDAAVSDTWEYFAKTGPVTSMQFQGTTLWCGTSFGMVAWDTETTKYTIFRANEGLPACDIIGLTLDAEGVLWAATSQHGIVSREGGTWKYYTTADGLPADHCLSIAADSSGAVWVGCYDPGYVDVGKGLTSYDGVSWESRYMYPRPYAIGDKVFDISFSPAGVVETVYDSRWATLSDSTWTLHDMPANVRYVRHAADGTLWMVTQTAVYRIEGEVPTETALPEGFNAAALVKPVSAGADNSVYIASPGGGLARYGTGGWERLRADDGGSWLTAMTIDGNGTVWCGSADGGVARFSGTDWERHSLNEGPVNGRIYGLARRPNGELWAAGQNGVYLFSGSRWIEKTTAEDLPVTYPGDRYSFFFDTGGTAWIRDTSNDVYRYTGTAWVQDHILDSDVDISQVIPGIDDDLYLTCWQTINFRNRPVILHYDITTQALEYVPFPEPVYVNNFMPRLLKAATDGSLWCSFFDSERFMWRLGQYLGGSWHHYPEMDVRGDDIYSHHSGIGYAADGTVWATTFLNRGSDHEPGYAGALSFKQKGTDKFETVYENNSEGLSLQCVDSTGRVWMSSAKVGELARRYGAGARVYRYDRGNIVQYDDGTGLQSNVVFDVVEDGNHRIWIGTGNGIAALSDIHTGMDDVVSSPELFSIITPYPNPFNARTVIRFVCAVPGKTVLDVYTVSGQKVATLVDRTLVVGTHTVVWDGRDARGNSVASGVYIVKLNMIDRIATGKMTFLK